ncbi:tetratricopeptide repeat protein [Arsenicicoccus dermatophilus]|uniref:tetratricopeptide repeat protein n=1 Tax=Arsenicicoccus dermatophilus TaxID=1076331 RepID=UPI0039175B45
MTATPEPDRSAEILLQVWRDSDPADPGPPVARVEALYGTTPEDPGPAYELASTYDWAGREGAARGLYEQALAGGLDPVRERAARIRLGSTLRVLGRAEQSVAVLQEAVRRHPDSAAARCFLALALTDAGRAPEAVALLVQLACDTVDTPEMRDYRRALTAYAVQRDPAPATGDL